MITADELRGARTRAGFRSQKAFAEALGVAERTVTNWETEGGRVSPRAEARVRALLWPVGEPTEPLANLSDARLVAEIYTRLGILAERLENLSQRSGNRDAIGERWINADTEHSA